MQRGAGEDQGGEGCACAVRVVGLAGGGGCHGGREARRELGAWGGLRGCGWAGAAPRPAHGSVA